jgi:hypothetical protein
MASGGHGTPFGGWQTAAEDIHGGPRPLPLFRPGKGLHGSGGAAREGCGSGSEQQGPQPSLSATAAEFCCPKDEREGEFGGLDLHSMLAQRLLLPVALQPLEVIEARGVWWRGAAAQCRVVPGRLVCQVVQESCHHACTDRLPPYSRRRLIPA